MRRLIADAYSPGALSTGERKSDMRTLIIARPASPPPLDMMNDLLQAFKAWRGRWQPKMEAFEFFGSGAGGWGVFNTEDEIELSQAMLEYPFQPFSNVEAIPTVNGDEALERSIAVFQQMGEQASSS